MTKEHMNVSVLRRQGGTPVFTLASWTVKNIRYSDLNFLFLSQNMCYAHSKDPSQWDGSFEHPKHMFDVWVRKKDAIL